MIMPVSRPIALASNPVTVRSFTLTEVPTGPGALLSDPKGSLTIADTASLFSTGTVLWRTPLAALLQFINVGQVVPLGGGTTSNGLAIIAIPSGVSIAVDFS
jgi:hypothetical protein